MMYVVSWCFLACILSFPFKSTALVSNTHLTAAEGGRFHPCYRLCFPGDTRTCVFDFTVSEHITMGSECGRCPYVTNDCYRQNCIPGGGYIRHAFVVNNKLPGTGIEVCLGDTVVVNVKNRMHIEGTTIHWHGIHQKESPYMDGVPGVTQCSIMPGSTFRYTFKADYPGTHMWHSHMGFEETDGVFGPLVVRRSIWHEPNMGQYDFDLSEHYIMIWHWFPRPTKDIVVTAQQRNEAYRANGFIINGKGKLNKITDHCNLKQNTTKCLPYYTPREEFKVLFGFRYRFRVAFSTAPSCPIQFSIDNHKLRIIAVDGANVQPVDVDSFIVHAGERVDFVLHAYQKIDAYWIRVRGLEACNRPDLKIHQEAVLKYIGSATSQPKGEPTYEDGIRLGTILNPMGISVEQYPEENQIHITDLRSNEKFEDDIAGNPDHIIYMELGLNTYGHLDHPGPYAQLNNISFHFPSSPVMSQPGESEYCTRDNLEKFCSGGWCSCPYTIETSLNSLIEVVLVDSFVSAKVSHPMHLHGQAFRVVAMYSPTTPVTLNFIQQLNEMGLIMKNFQNAPLKDTLTVPAQGFAVVRFRTTNPGYWLFHCHISNHAEHGMVSILKVGEDREMLKPPATFPRCGDWFF